MVMEVTSIITFVYKIALDIHDRAELATECTEEASRIARRIRHLVSTLDSATDDFKSDARLQLMLIELRTFLDSIPPLLCECAQPLGTWSKLRLVARVKPLAKALAKKEEELEHLTNALSLHMLTTVGAGVKLAGADTVAQISAKIQDLDICEKKDVRRIVEKALERTLVHESWPKTTTTILTGKVFGRVSKDDLVQDEKPFAEGMFGFVYGGTYCGKHVAIKKAKFDILPLKETLVFRREAELHFAMRHPNIVEVFGYSASSPVCLIMERMNQTLSDFLGLDLTIAFADKMSILEGVAKGLRFMHSIGIVHMDVKSSNILLDGEGTPKLSDFGLAQVASRVHASSTSSTPCKVGSYMWMAPEVHSSGLVSREADVFSFAVVAHEVMTQRTPPRGMPFGLAKSYNPRAQLILGDVEGARYMGSLINQCTELQPRVRPKMEDIVEELRVLKVETAPILERVPDVVTRAWQERVVRGGPNSTSLNRIDADLVLQRYSSRPIVGTSLNHMSLNHEEAKNDWLTADGVRGSEWGIVRGKAFDAASWQWPVPSLVCLLPAHEGALSEEDRSYSSWSGKLRKFCQEGRNVTKGVPSTNLRLFFLCGHDWSLAECGHEGQGYDVDKLLASLEDSNLSKMVGYTLVNIASRVCTGLAVPTHRFTFIFGTIFGGATVVVEDMGDIPVMTLANSDDGEWRERLDPPKVALAGADVPIYEFLENAIKTFELAELTKRGYLSFHSFRSGMRLVDRGGRGKEWKWVRIRNLHAFVKDTR